MAIYLIDYENVNSGGFLGLENLGEKDAVAVFYSEKVNTITISVHAKLMQTRADVSFIKTTATGANCLDFQLSSYLGYLVAKSETEKYFIVSKDKGFDGVVDFWTKKNVFVSRVSDLTQRSEKSIKETIISSLPQYKDDAGKILTLLEKYKTKQGFNNALMKEFGNDKTSVIYKALKPLLSDKKGS